MIRGEANPNVGSSPSTAGPNSEPGPGDMGPLQPFVVRPFASGGSPGDETAAMRLPAGDHGLRQGPSLRDVPP
jgi:hypothetical protein